MVVFLNTLLQKLCSQTFKEILKLNGSSLFFLNPLFLGEVLSVHLLFVRLDMRLTRVGSQIKTLLIV